jgi:GT2 family glycosyltransferase
MELRGLNEIYGMGTYEDMEYCFLIRSKGRKVLFNPKAVGHHYVGASLGQADGPGGFPLGRNEAIFRANVGNTIVWDEWKWW